MDTDGHGPVKQRAKGFTGQGFFIRELREWTRK
jgi:hypothetical protein